MHNRRYMQFMPAAGATQHKIAHIVLTLVFIIKTATHEKCNFNCIIDFYSDC